MLQDFAANLQQEGEPAVGDKAFEGLGDNQPSKQEPEESQKETETAPPADEQTKTTEPSQDGVSSPDENKLPFHKHPRWIKTQQELSQLREYKASTEPRLQTYEQVIAKMAPSETAKKSLPPMPDWFTAVYGNNEEMWAKQVEFFDGLKAQARQEFLNEQVQREQQAQAESDRWTGWVKDSLQNLKDEGLRFDDNELQKVALDYLPTDLDGNIDFRKAYDIMNKLNEVKNAPQKEKVEAKKQIADMTMGKSKAEKPKEQFQTAQSLRNQSWDKLIRE